MLVSMTYLRRARCLSENIEDLLGASDDPLGGVLDQLAESIRPTSHIGKAVVAGVEPKCIADDVGDRLDLDLLYLSGPDDVVAMQQRVGELVDERLDGLGGCDVRAHRDPLVEEVAVAVLRSLLIADHLEAGGKSCPTSTRSVPNSSLVGVKGAQTQFRHAAAS